MPPKLSLPYTEGLIEGQPNAKMARNWISAFNVLINAVTSFVGSAGSLAVFGSGGTIVRGNLSGDVTTSGATATTIAAGAVTEAKQTLADVTTLNVSTSKHGYTPKLPNDATKFLNGTGAYSVPGGSGGTVTVTGSPVSGNLTKFSGASSITNGDLSGDVTTSGTLAATLANSGVTANTYGDSTHVPQIAVDAKGRITSASSVAISGAGAVQSVTVTLTNSQILGLGTTPVDIVPAPGAGLVTQLVAIMTSSDCSAGAYNNPTILFRRTGGSVDLVTGSSSTLNNTTKRTQFLTLQAQAESTSASANLAIQITTAGTAVTGGNAANQYRIVAVYATYSAL